MTFFSSNPFSLHPFAVFLFSCLLCPLLFIFPSFLLFFLRELSSTPAPPPLPPFLPLLPLGPSAGAGACGSLPALLVRTWAFFPLRLSLSLWAGQGRILYSIVYFQPHTSFAAQTRLSPFNKPYSYLNFHRLFFSFSVCFLLFSSPAFLSVCSMS